MRIFPQPLRHSMRRPCPVARQVTSRSIHLRFKRRVHNRARGVRRICTCFASSLYLSPWQDKSPSSLFPPRPRLASARSRRRPRSRRLRPSKRRSSSGVAGGTAGTIRPGAAQAGTSVALLGGGGSAGAEARAGMAGAIRASSTGLLLDRQSTARVLPSRGRQSVGLAPAPPGPATTDPQRTAPAAIVAAANAVERS